MNKATIRYGENGAISIEAHGNKPLYWTLYTTNYTVRIESNDILCDDDGVNKSLVDAMAKGIKTTFRKNHSFHFVDSMIQAKDVRKIEISDERGKVLSTVVNEVAN